MNPTGSCEATPTDLELAGLVAERIAARPARVRFRHPFASDALGIAYRDMRNRACIDLLWSELPGWYRVEVLVHEAQHIGWEWKFLPRVPARIADAPLRPPGRYSKGVQALLATVRSVTEEGIRVQTAEALFYTQEHAEHYHLDFDARTWYRSMLVACIQAPPGELCEAGPEWHASHDR